MLRPAIGGGAASGMTLSYNGLVHTREEVAIGRPMPEGRAMLVMVGGDRGHSQIDEVVSKTSTVLATDPVGVGTAAGENGNQRQQGGDRLVASEMFHEASPDREDRHRARRGPVDLFRRIEQDRPFTDRHPLAVKGDGPTAARCRRRSAPMRAAHPASRRRS